MFVDICLHVKRIVDTERGGPDDANQNKGGEWAGGLLIVDDDQAMCDVMLVAARKRGFTAVACPSVSSGLEHLKGGDFDVVVTDLYLQGQCGLDLCKQIAATREDLPVVVITAFGSLESAVAAIRTGAYDYLTKPFEMDALVLTLTRAVQHRELKAEVRRLRRAVTVAPRCRVVPACRRPGGRADSRLPPGCIRRDPAGRFR